MKKFTACMLAIALALVGNVAPLRLIAPSAAFAETTTGSSTALSSPYESSYTYYSDLYFKGGGSATLAVGKTKNLSLVNFDGDISWKSSDTRIATVTQTGVVTARREGVARVTALNEKTGRSVTCTVKVYKKRTQKQARKAILKLKKSYRQGRRWTDSNYYYWQAANCHCYGCVAFAGIASDKAFGKFAPLKRHAKLSKIKVGDHVRIGGEHSMIVLSKKKKSIVVVEGNYNDKINWGREVTNAELKRQGFYVETRY